MGVENSSVILHGNHVLLWVCEKGSVVHIRAGRKRTRGRTKEAKIRLENNNKNCIKGIKRRIWQMRDRIRGERGA